MSIYNVTVTKIKIQNKIKISAKISADNSEFWVSVPEKYEQWLTDLSDPWLNILAFPMMKIGGRFNINGAVSQSLIDNIEMFSAIWSIWCPEQYKPIKIVPEKIVSIVRTPDENKLISAFSGGLDAAYTAYKYKNNLNGVRKYDLDAAVMIHGADIPLAETQQFNDAFKHAKNMTDDLKIELIPAQTNYREYSDNWSFEFGSVISGVLSLFSKKYAAGAASDDSVHHFETPWGMNPISDWYLKSDVFNFISDGHNHSRTERAQFVSKWQACLDNLRVCWRNEDKSKNCGKCEKCVRTKLNFMAVGVNHLPTMPNDLTKEELHRKDLIQMNHNVIYFEEILKFAKQNNSLPKYWYQQLDDCIKVWKQSRNKKRHGHSFWWHVRHFKF